jgi:hypothetical protein
MLLPCASPHTLQRARALVDGDSIAGLLVWLLSPRWRFASLRLLRALLPLRMLWLFLPLVLRRR